jgi:hypothetical protein
VLRTRVLARILWSLTGVTTMAGCGRLGFGQDAIAIVTPPLEIMTECGVEPTSADVEITNDGSTPLVIERFETTGGFGMTSKLPVVIDPGATTSLSVVAPPAVIGTDVSGSTKTGTLTLFTNDTEEPEHTITLEARVVGAQLAFDAGGGVSLPVTLTFSADMACPAPKGVAMYNNGDRPATFTLTAPSSFRVSPPFTGTLDAGQSGFFQVRPLTSGPCTGSEAITYAVTGSVCSSVPAVLDASFMITGAQNCSCS